MGLNGAPNRPRHRTARANSNWPMKESLTHYYAALGRWEHFLSIRRILNPAANIATLIALRQGRLH